MRTLIRRTVFLSLLLVVGGAIAYVRSEGFARTLRKLVVTRLEERGIYLNLQGLYLDPMEGIVAKGIEVYQDGAHQTLLARVDRLNVDFNFSKLMQKEIEIEGVDLRKADLSFPLDPDDPRSEHLVMRGLSARVMLTGERIEIRQAEGDLYGLHLSVTGALLRPKPSKDEDEERRARERNRRILAAIRERRDLIMETAKILKHFETARAPRLDIEVNGDLAKPEELTGSLHLMANGLRHGDYVCEELEARASYAGQLIDLSSLRLRDKLGLLEASATYEIGGDAVDFHVRSGANLSGLAAAVTGNDAMHEVVFYEPVDIAADGRVFLGKAVPKDAFVPVECSGSVRIGRFASRGEVMEGLSVNFGLSPEGCYFRDGLLRHKSGTLGLQAMWKHGDGFRYRALLRMDPHTFIPFIQFPQTNEFIRRFGFREDSSIFAEVEGHGPTANIGNDCKNHAHVELHHFKYHGEEFSRAETDMDFEGPQHFFHNMRFERPEGTGSAREIDWDDDAHTVRFVGLVSDMNAVAVVGCFAPPTADVIARYRFDRHPHSEVDGILFLDNPGTDLRVKFRGEGTAHYVLWGEDYVISKPTGDLHFKSSKLAYDVHGVTFGKDMSCKGDVDLADGANDYTVDLRAGSFPYLVFSKHLPFEKLRATVLCRKGIAEFNVKANLFDGDFELRGKMDDRKQPQPFTGDLRINAVSFKKFARVYSPEFETEGDFTGHAEFSGVLGDWKKLKGQGALVILNSNLYAVPILGPLTQVISGMLPSPIKGFNVAKEADATFTMADGFVTTDDLVASTKVFTIAAKGKIDYLEDRIDFHAQVKFGKLLGLVLFPVSKILEYTGEGSVGDPIWRPRFFSGSTEKIPFRKQDQAARPYTEPIPPSRAGASSKSTEIPKAKPVEKEGLFSRPAHPPVRSGR